MLATCWLAEVITLPSVTDAASNGWRRSSPTPGTRDGLLGRVPQLFTSRVAVRAVSRAGTASTSTTWWTKMPTSAQATPQPEHEEIADRAVRRADRAVWRRWP